MENCNQNHKRDFAIILSILFHVLLFLFIFYKIKQQFDEPQTEQAQQQNNNPIFLSQDLASNVEQTTPEKPIEQEIPQEALDLATQVLPNLPEMPEEEVQEVEEQQEATQEEQSNELAQELKKFEEFNEAEKLLEKPKELAKPTSKRTRRSILNHNPDMPTIPNIIDYVKKELKTNLFKMVGDNSNVDMKYLSYQQKILSFFEKAFAALYVGKTLGIPKHEYDQLAMGVVIEIAIEINKDGTVRWLNVRSSLTKLNACLEHALQYAAPYPNIPKNFNMEIFRLKTKFPMGLQHSGKGLMQVYPT